jgi:outer membrane protein assembly factor BamB
MIKLRPTSFSAGSRLLCIAVLASASVHAADWPQWRGPNRNSVVQDTRHALDTLPKDPKARWQIDVGPGLSSPVIARGELVYLDAQNEQETAHCLDAATGRSIWNTTVGPAASYSPAFGGGPRCTPLIDGDRVYVQSGMGEFRCISLADGKMIWGVSFAADYGATFLGKSGGALDAKETGARQHGNNGSAAIDGDRVFVPVGSPNGATLVCFDKRNGREIWRVGNDNTAYSSVMVATLAGVRQVVHFTAEALMGVDAVSGKLLWRVPPKAHAKRHTCTPVISGDDVLIASTNIGTEKLHIERRGASFTAEAAWTNVECKTMLTTPILVGKSLFTLGPGDHASLICLDFDTGRQLWAQPGFGDYVSLTAVNDKVLVLNSNGEAALIKAEPSKYEELGRTQLCGQTWASPAYADGVIYVKDMTHLAAIVLAP